MLQRKQRITCLADQSIAIKKVGVPESKLDDMAGSVATEDGSPSTYYKKHFQRRSKSIFGGGFCIHLQTKTSVN